VSFFRALFGIPPADSAPAHLQGSGPQASGGSTMISINSPQELEEALRTGMTSGSGQPVTEMTAMRTSAVFACVRIRAGAIANMPLDINERVNETTRRDRSDLPVWKVVCRRPNKWQKPAQFKRMMEAHVLLRGNAYALISRGVSGQVLSLTPLHPDRVEPKQLDDQTVVYEFTRKTGGKIVLPKEDVFHLMGLSLDGIKGLNPMAYMRETIGLSLAEEAHGSSVFRNGANVTGAFKLPAGRTLTKEQAESLRAQLDEFRAGGSKDMKSIVLEDGLEYTQMALTAEDAQWIESRKFSRGDIAMFFGVPPHMIGDTDKATSWGTGLETQGQGFVTYTLEDSLTAWEEAIGADLIDWEKNPKIYARFNRNALVRGDIKTRWEAHVKAMQWGVMSPNEVRALEDLNPRLGGDVYYDPPNTAGGDSNNMKDGSNVNP
jgi:HK97 family phage portal protein